MKFNEGDFVKVIKKDIIFEDNDLLNVYNEIVGKSFVITHCNVSPNFHRIANEYKAYIVHESLLEIDNNHWIFLYE